MASLLKQVPLKVLFLFNGWNQHCFSSGELDSHSLLFEARHNWTGLLVEPMVNITMFSTYFFNVLFYPLH